MRRIRRLRTFALLASAWIASGAAAAEPACRYDVAIEGAEARALAVQLRCDAAAVTGFRLPPAAAAAARFETAEGVPLAAADGVWTLPAGAAALRYRLDLDRLAAAADSYEAALRRGGSVVAAPAYWIAEPIGPASLPLAIEVTSADGAAFASAMPRREGAYRIGSAALAHAGPSVFGGFARERIALPSPGSLAPDAAAPGEAQLELVILDRPMAASPAALAAWVRDTGLAIADYWHGFPVAEAMVLVLPVAGADDIPYGRVLAEGGVTVLLLIGDRAPARDLYGEWVLMHEFVHLGSPYIRDTGAWLNEGLATYIEPVIRARAGWRTPESVWWEWVTFFPRGLNAVARDGLRRARLSGGVYWGGALFMLLADIEMRAANGGRAGIEDCVRTVLLEHGADITQVWTTERMLAACDAAVGGRVLQDLAARHLKPGAALDLPGLWARLGVALRDDGTVALDDSAPLAHLRQSILAGGPATRTRRIPMTAE